MREGFVKACEEDKLSNDSPMILVLNGVEVLLFKVGAKVFATSARCTHRDCSLGEGWLDRKGYLVCGCHLSKFDPKSGKVVEGPATSPLKVFEALVEDGFVWVKVS